MTKNAKNSVSCSLRPGFTPTRHAELVFAEAPTLFSKLVTSQRKQEAASHQCSLPERSRNKFGMTSSAFAFIYNTCSIGGFSKMLNTKSIKFEKVQENLDFLGYRIKIEKKLFYP
jgi:hypothetical protein